jgi:hypothetical protein
MLGHQLRVRKISGLSVLAALLALAACIPNPDEIKPHDQGGSGGAGGTAAGGTPGTGGVLAMGGTPGTGGAGAGGSGGGGTVTVGEVCDVTGMAFCKHFEDCGYGDAASCVMRYQGGCCKNDSKCALTTAPSKREAAHRCADAFSAQTCPDLIDQTKIPPVCQTL